MTRRRVGRSWTLLTSHGHVLVEIARNPQALIRELAEAADLTERATTAIVADLEDAGYVTRQRIGRRNQYQVHLDLPFRHPQQSGLRVGPFLDLLTGGLLLQEAGALSAVSVARTDAQHGLFGIGSAPLTVISSAEPPTSQ